MKTLTVVTEVPAETSTESMMMLRGACERMVAKFVAAEAKYGWHDAWRHNLSEAQCREYLMEHIRKGDPADVMVIAAFMVSFGWRTAP